MTCKIRKGSKKNKRENEQVKTGWNINERRGEGGQGRATEGNENEEEKQGWIEKSKAHVYHYEEEK